MAPSLLFIPDISGFTKFVKDTEVEHGRHIIAELLDLIIESDALGLTVAEVEGDAVFFYKDGPLPSPDALIAQARATFEAFHTHLKRYETRRICDCGACTTAHRLTLKFVAHAGPIELLEVRGFMKPYGSDVIVAHRLLKNEIEESEYLLLTDAVLGSEELTPPVWSSPRPGSAEVADVGRVGYRYLSLTTLKEGLPAPPPIEALERVARPIVAETFIECDPADLFELITNFDLRLAWNHGVDELEYEPNRVNRVGTIHRCVIDGALIEFETATDDFGDGSRVYGERIIDNPVLRFLHVFYIVAPEESGARIRVEAHPRAKPFPRGLLGLLFRLRLAKQLPETLERIREAATERARERAGALVDA